MEKYLFTDGTNVTREVMSQEELKTLIDSSPAPEKIKIWIFNTNEWITYSAYSKKSPPFPLKIAPANPPAKNNIVPQPSGNKRWLRKFLLFIVGLGVIFLVYNFTKIRWQSMKHMAISAGRPSNMPPMNIDSLIQSFEETRNQKLDKVTKTNLRIRNTWPERILLRLDADRDSSSAGSRYYNLGLSIDNSTGYNLDNAIVKLTVWNSGQVSVEDSFQFSNISYAAAAKRRLDNLYKGDSLSVSFQSIKAKVFNFCYSADKKSNYGNNNDRWFCRE